MFLKRVYSEICVIRVRIFILVSLLCEFVTFRRKKGESIFIAGRIANKTQFLRPNRCVAAERTTEYESYDKVQVGNRIRGSRLEKGWTQERLAAEAEISVQQLRALEKGQRNLGVDHLGRLSDAMGVSSDFLLKGCSENSILVCKMLDDLKKKLQPPKQIAEK